MSEVDRLVCSVHHIRQTSTAGDRQVEETVHEPASIGSFKSLSGIGDEEGRLTLGTLAADGVTARAEVV